MTSCRQQTIGEDTALVVPSPVLYNTWKHHLQALRLRLPQLLALPPEHVAERIAILGGGLMDMYVGPLSPRDISQWILDSLRESGRLDLDAYRSWLAGQDDYTTLTHPDGTAWVLRLGEVEDRYVHLHPGRHTPNTVRVRANVVKTAIAVTLQGGEATRRRVNEARQLYLNLPPIGRAPADEEGLGAFLRLLNSD